MLETDAFVGPPAAAAAAAIAAATMDIVIVPLGTHMATVAGSPGLPALSGHPQGVCSSPNHQPCTLSPRGLENAAEAEAPAPTTASPAAGAE